MDHVDGVIFIGQVVSYIEKLALEANFTPAELKFDLMPIINHQACQLRLNKKLARGGGKVFFGSRNTKTGAVL